MLYRALYCRIAVTAAAAVAAAAAAAAADACYIKIITRNWFTKRLLLDSNNVCKTQ